MNLTIAHLQLVLTERDKQWDPDKKLSLTFRATELAGECGEACNVVKKIERERLGLRGSRAGLVDLEQELADVIICTILLANSVGLDMTQAITEKFNSSSIKLGLSARL